MVMINIGQRFGRWTVSGSEFKSDSGRLKVPCVCDCGTVKDVTKYYLTSGKSKSCKCYQSDKMRSLKTVHGGCGTREYRIWKAMIARCNNPNVPHYKNYGGRGISVCDRWANSFENFLLDMGKCPKSFSVDRIDVNGNYEPSNCAWASASQQARNKRPKTATGVCGVTWFRGAWRAQIGAGDKGFFLGDYSDFFEAVCARKSGELKHWGGAQ